MDRPSPALLDSIYDGLFNSTLDKLRADAIHGCLFDNTQDEKGAPGRSIAWKLFLIHQLPLTGSLNPHPIPPLDSLRHSRQRYLSLLREKMRAPDGTYEEDFRATEATSHRRPSASRAANVTKNPNDWTLNNPLSLDSSNPWHAYFSALELRDTIRQDVERTFPDVSYFRSPAVQNEMTHILFLHVSERQDIGYRQGMHELLACVYQTVDFDSIEKGKGEVRPDLEELCDREYIAADAFTLFGTIMKQIESWYEWRLPVTNTVSPTSPIPHVTHISASGELLPTRQPQIDVLENGQLDLKPYIAPIVQTCLSLRDEKLRAVDPHLWQKVREGGVEPQMYGIRWLRLLFTREFALGESMVIWDALFASVSEDAVSPSSLPSGQGFKLALWISVAMLVRIRNILISGDYTTQLTNLLRYPAPSALGTSSQMSNAPDLLLRQAQLLMTSPTPATGASLVMQNRNELGIPVQAPDPPAPSPIRLRRRASATAPPTVSASQSKLSHSHDKLRVQDMISNRFVDANESSGIQRGIFNTISELRKNLPDFSQTLIRTPWNGSSISLADERSSTSRSAQSSAACTPEVAERPPWEPRPRSEIEQEIAELRALLKTLGNAVGWAVDVLLLDEEAKETKEDQASLRKKKREAVECLSYVRDVLARGGRGDIDEERLVSEEEYKRQRKMKQDRERAVKMGPQPPNPVLPPPRAASPSDSLDTVAKSHAALSKDSSRPISSLTRTPIQSFQFPTSSSTTSPAPIARTTQIPRPRPHISSAIPSSAPTSRIVTPPWQHTVSNFSGASPYASGSLPRLPPPTTTVPPRVERRSSDHPYPQSSPPKDYNNSPEADPLGVLRR